MSANKINNSKVADDDFSKGKREQSLLSDEQIKAEYQLKSEMLASQFDLSECYLEEFVQLIFERKVIGSEEVQPFEDIQSKEYLYWKTQKMDRKQVMDYHGYACWRYNPIVFFIADDKPKEHRNRHRLILRDDDETMAFLEGRKFALLSPITYVGRNNTRDNARYLYGFAFDLDGVGSRQLVKLMKMMFDNVVPSANIIVNSGHGLHLYYLLEQPVALFADGIPLLNKMKHGLTNVIWNENTSVDECRQYQSIFQSFRMPGTLTKFGARIRAFSNANAPMYSLKVLNSFLTKYRLKNEELDLIGKKPQYNSTGVTIDEAKRRWPEWYASRIVDKKRIIKRWNVSRAVYDWWLDKLRDTDDEIKIHHRYWCILTLVIYAIKCNIAREEVLKDAYSLIGKMESYTDADDNHFTKEDVEDAMRAYEENYCTWPLDTIEKTTNIRIDRNRRNGRKQELHLKRARAVQAIDDPEGNWRKGNGRKLANLTNSIEAKKIQEWRKHNPNSKNKSKCACEIGLHRNTVARWWNVVD